MKLQIKPSGFLRWFHSQVSPFSLMILIILFWIKEIITKIGKKFPLFLKFNLVLNMLIAPFDPPQKPASITRIDLIKLAIKNMQQKKARTRVTIFGMTIGIASIVFLVSIGYGLQDLVINRVARLEEMRQADVSVPPGSNLSINEDTLISFARIPSINTIAPMIALVGKASYQNSATDLVIYGVTRDYLEQSAIQPVKGDIFSNNDIILPNQTKQAVDDPELQTDEVPQVQEVLVTLQQSEWYRVRATADANAPIIGYTRSQGQDVEGESVIGGEYLVDGQLHDSWVKVDVPIWSQEDDDTYEVVTNEEGVQLNRFGYIVDTGLTIVSIDPQAVANNVGINGLKVSQQVQLPDEISRKVVINRATLGVLGLAENDAVGTAFEISFVVTGDLLENNDVKVESIPTSYTIVGVTPDDNSPVIYVPITDLRMMGIDKFSQVKVSVTSDNQLAKVRSEIETQGFTTSSVVDTVSGINSIFATARTMLLVVGMVALVIASLGMFNTLTVSLLERTREVGLMKAMGLKSSEIKDLFLAESLIMGFSGGVFGLLMGYVMAKIIETVISVYTFTQGIGFIDIVSVPGYFIATILLLSFIVGLFTGLFPARRATRISALNALRYE